MPVLCMLQVHSVHTHILIPFEGREPTGLKVDTAGKVHLQSTFTIVTSAMVSHTEAKTSLSTGYEVQSSPATPLPPPSGQQSPLQLPQQRPRKRQKHPRLLDTTGKVHLRHPSPINCHKCNCHNDVPKGIKTSLSPAYDWQSSPATIS